MYKFHPKPLPDTFSISLDLAPRLFWTGLNWTEDQGKAKPYYRREDAIQGSRKMKLLSHNLLRVNLVEGNTHHETLCFISKK